MSELILAVHDWETTRHAASRQELVEKLGRTDGGEGSAPAMFTSIAGTLLTLSRMTDAQMRAESPQVNTDPWRAPAVHRARRAIDRLEPGRSGKLKRSGSHAGLAAGGCCAPLIAEGDVFFTDPAAQVAPGDVVILAAKGVVVTEAKVFLGAFDRLGRRAAIFYQARPELLWEIPVDDLVHVEKVALIKRPDEPLAALDGRGILPDNPIVKAVMAKHDGNPLPKGSSLLASWEEALYCIIERLRELPDTGRIGA